MKQKSVIIDYTEGNIVRQLLIFAIPFMLSALLQNLYSLVDSLVVGNFVGAAGLSGVSISTLITNFMTNLAMGFATGGQVIISQYVGSRDYKGIRRTLGTLFTITTIFALVLTLVCIVFSGPILSAMNTPAEALDQARDYLIICSFGFVFICGYNAACAVLRGSGDSKRPFVIVAATALTNLVLDLLFVVGFKMEAAGAALATVISQAVSAVIAVWIFYCNRDTYGFEFKLSSFKPDGEAFKLLMRQGIPLALKSSAISLSSLFVNSLVNSYGLAASAAIAVGRKLEQVPSIVSQGLFNAGSAMIGQNVGAGKFDRVKSIVRTSLLVSCVTFALVGAVFVSFPEFFFKLFTDDPAVLEYAVPFTRILIIVFVGCALMVPYYTVVLGIGNASFNLVISVFDGIVLRIGLGLLLGKGLGMGVIGFYLGSGLAAFGTTIPSMVYYFTGRWKTYSAIK